MSSTYLVKRWINGKLYFIPVTIPGALQYSPVTVNKITYNGVDYTSGSSLSTSPNILSGTSTTNGINYNVYAFGSTSFSYTVNYTAPNASVIYVLAVGGGGGGASYGGAGGGAGGVVMNPVFLPAGTSTITVSIGDGGIGSIATTSSGTQYCGSIGNNTTVTFTAATSYNITAGGGSGGVTSAGIASPYTQYGSGGGSGMTLATNTKGIFKSNNYSNDGGLATVTSSDIAGGGGGAGLPGLWYNTYSAGIYGGIGGDGIQCYLPGIRDFSPSGISFGTYYWGGGGGGGAGGGGNNSASFSRGGAGGGGGGGINGTPYTINPGGYGLNNGAVGGRGSGANGGAGGTNTGGGGGGSWLGAGGKGGSGIVIIAFPASGTNYVITDTTANLTTTLIKTNYYYDILSNTALSPTAYNSIYGAFATRLVNYKYYGPVFTVRYQGDTNGVYTKNFYADISGNIGSCYFGTGIPLSQWLASQGSTSTSYAFITKWYDQGMDFSFNCAYQYTTGSQPSYDLTNGVVDFGYTNAPQSSCFFNLPNGAIPYNTYYSVSIRHKAILNTSTGGFLGCGENTGTSAYKTNKENNFRLGVGYYYNYWYSNDFLPNSGASYASGNVATYVASNNYTNATTITGSTSSASTTLYVNGTQSTYTEPAARTGWACTNINSAIGRTTELEYLNGQLYNLYVLACGLSDNDRAIIEATNYNYTATPYFQLTLSGINHSTNTFTVSWSAVTNATYYILFLNGSIQGTTTGLTFSNVTTNYMNTFCVINVYAYNASNYLLGRGHTSLAEGVSTTGLVCWYPLDTDFNNIITGTADGTKTGNPTISNTIYNVGNGSLATSSGNYFNSCAITLSANPGLTTCCWAYFTSLTSSNTAIINFAQTAGNVNVNNWFQLWVSTATLSLAFFNNSGNQYNGTLNPTITLSTGVWYHFAITLTAAATTTLTIYLNGTQIFSGSYANIAAATYYTSFGGANVYTVGNVDDCRTYTRALTQQEVAQLATMRN